MYKTSYKRFTNFQFRVCRLNIYFILVDEAKTLDQSHILLTVIDIVDSLSNDRMIQHQATTLHCYKGQSFIVGSEGVTIGIGALYYFF